MGREISPMINAWSLAASILDGTFDKDYPIMKKKEEEHSDAYYDYTRNDPDAKNPFTDPEDRARAEKVVGNYDKDLEWIAKSGGFEWTPGSPWPPTDPYPTAESSAAFFPSASQAASAQSDLYGYEDDGLDYESDFIADIDDQRAHHFSTYDDGFTLQVTEEKPMEYEPKTAHFYKYHEEEILKDIEEYVSSTYQGHYTGTKHEFRKVQTIDLMAARDIAPHFCQANILKYGSRYGSKNGRDKKDLLKVIHYAMLLLHFDGHYGEPSMPSGNFDQMP